MRLSKRRLTKAGTPIHLVVRFSDRLLHGVDTIAEHQKVLERRGKVWFGKVGKPMGDTTLEVLDRQVRAGVPSYMYLVQRTENKYDAWKGTLVEVQNYAPTNHTELIPTYYFGTLHLENLGFWAQLSDLVPVTGDELSKLYSVSSHTAIVQTLLSSMAGLFVVTKEG